MGVAPAAFTLGIVLVGALGVAAFEWRVLRWREAGPAWRTRLRRRVQPPYPDPWLYAAGPIVLLLAVAWGAVVIPFGPGLVGADLSIGLFYFIVVVDFTVLAIALAGWGANSWWSVEACYRAVAQLVAYVVPLGLAIIGPAMMARSLSTVSIIEAQRDAGLWYALVQPLGFGLYLVTGLMQSYRAPFLEPFSVRIRGGVLGASGGWHAVAWRIGLSALLFLVAAMGVVLFLGGWTGPVLPGWLWMAVKTFGLAAAMVLAGSWVHRRSTAEMLALAWKVLIPVGLFNVLVVGALILLGVGQP